MSLRCNKCGEFMKAPRHDKATLLTDMACVRHLTGDSTHEAYKVFDPEAKLFDTYCAKMESFTVAD